MRVCPALNAHLFKVFATICSYKFFCLFCLFVCCLLFCFLITAFSQLFAYGTFNPSFDMYFDLLTFLSNYYLFLFIIIVFSLHAVLIGPWYTCFVWPTIPFATKDRTTWRWLFNVNSGDCWDLISLELSNSKYKLLTVWLVFVFAQKVFCVKLTTCNVI